MVHGGRQLAESYRYPIKVRNGQPGKTGRAELHRLDITSVDCRTLYITSLSRAPRITFATLPATVPPDVLWSSHPLLYV